MVRKPNAQPVVTAGGGSCPFRFRCLGCGHFRTDPSYLPELRGYLDSLLQARERIRSAADLDGWARAEAMPSDACHLPAAARRTRMSSRGTESLIAARRRDTTRRRQRVLDALGQLAAAGQEISVSAVARKAGVDRSFLYRHHDLRTQVHARSAAPAASPASTAASKQSLLADLANLREQNQRVRRQNTDLTARLPEVLGEEAFRASGIGRTDDTGALRTRVSQLEQQVLDLRQELEERTDDLDAARAANRGLISLANRKPSCAGES